MGGHRKFKRAAPSQPSMFVRAIPPICLALALGGCAVGPDFLPPEAPVQDKWIESGDKRVAKERGQVALVEDVQGSDARSPRSVRL